MAEWSSSMRLENLDIPQVHRIYNVRMKEDFPPAELKALKIIEEGIQAGFYRFPGLFDGDEIIGYTGLIYHEDACLIDYLAVMPEWRNRGIGSVMLKLLKAYLKDTEYVIGEVEIPACGEDEAERNLRSRRMDFYLRSGFYDTGMDVSVFGVRFRLLAFADKPHDGQEILTRYRNIYRYVLPEDLFRNNVLTD